MAWIAGVDMTASRDDLRSTLLVVERLARCGACLSVTIGDWAQAASNVAVAKAPLSRTAVPRQRGHSARSMEDMVIPTLSPPQFPTANAGQTVAETSRSRCQSRFR